MLGTEVPDFAGGAAGSAGTINRVPGMCIWVSLCCLHKDFGCSCRQVTLCLLTLARQFVNSDAVKATSLWEKKVKKDTDAKQPKQATETASKDMCKLLTVCHRVLPGSH